MDLVTPNPGTLFWMVIIFGLVVLILRKFAWKPILHALKERESHINNALQAARKAEKKVESLKEDNEKMIAEARREKEAILHEATELKKRIMAEAKERADAEKQNQIEHARHQIQNEKAKVLNEIKKQMAGFSLEIAEKIIRKKLEDDKEQQEMIKKLVDGIKLN